jgi:hypothetical protein
MCAPGPALSRVTPRVISLLTAGPYYMMMMMGGLQCADSGATRTACDPIHETHTVRPGGGSPGSSPRPTCGSATSTTQPGNGWDQMAYPQTSPEQLQTATTPLSGVIKRTTADMLACAHTPQAGSHAHHAQAPHSPEPPTGPGVRSKLFIASCHQPCGGPRATKASHDTAATLVRAQYTATISQLV